MLVSGGLRLLGQPLLFELDRGQIPQRLVWTRFVIVFPERFTPDLCFPQTSKQRCRQELVPEPAVETLPKPVLSGDLLSEYWPSAPFCLMEKGEDLFLRKLVLHHRWLAPLSGESNTSSGLNFRSQPAVVHLSPLTAALPTIYKTTWLASGRGPKPPFTQVPNWPPPPTPPLLGPMPPPLSLLQPQPPPPPLLPPPPLTASITGQAGRLFDNPLI